MALRPWMALALTFAAYIACISAGYVWDDRALILANDALVHPTFRKVLFSDLWCCSATVPSGYWRPLTTLSFYVDVAAFGFTPGWAHLHSLGWHLGCTGLVAGLAGSRYGQARGAIAALLFGLHPLSSEAVIWIAARNDLMAATFCVAATWAVDRKRAALAALAAFAALLSKESSALLPALVVCWAWAHEGVPGVRARARAIAGVFVGIGAALALRPLADLGSVGAFQRVPIEDPLAPVYTAARLLGWVLWPWPLTSTATMYLPPPGPGVWIPAALVVVGAALVIRANPRRGLGLAAFTVASGLPVIGALYVFATIGERYMYLPMVGLSTAVAAAIPLRATTTATLAGWSVCALAALHIRLPDWVDGLALFHAATTRAPDSFSWNLLGSELNQRELYPQALAAMQESLNLRPARRFSCTRVAYVARKVVTLEQYKSLVPAWNDAGCRDLHAFDFQVAWSLALLGDEEAGLHLLRDNPGDDGGVGGALRADAANREGDIVGAAFLLAASPQAEEARGRFSTLCALRSAA